MKMSLKEELLRIHTLSYEKNILSEQGLMDKLTGIFSNTNINHKDDKVVELQKALIMAGYRLPKYGADGILNPETETAIENFKRVNNIKTIDTNNPESLTQLIKRTTGTKIPLKRTTSQITNKPDNVGYDTVPSVLKKKKNDVEIKEPFTFLNLDTDEGFKKYAEISQTYINKRPPNPLGITGQMLALSAKNSFKKYGKYVPPELALAQLVIEGGIGNGNVNSRPIRTKNPFNVGNVDSGKNTFYKSVQDSINTYYSLMSKNYISSEQDPHHLLDNFVNTNGKRYASDPKYEVKISSVAKQVNNLAKTLI